MKLQMSYTNNSTVKVKVKGIPDMMSDLFFSVTLRAGGDGDDRG